MADPNDTTNSFTRRAILRTGAATIGGLTVATGAANSRSRRVDGYVQTYGVGNLPMTRYERPVFDQCYNARTANVRHIFNGTDVDLELYPMRDCVPTRPAKVLLPDEGGSFTGFMSFTPTRNPEDTIVPVPDLSDLL